MPATTLAQIDLALKILLALCSLIGIIFAAGWWWATISKLVGSVEALHRRMTEDQTARQHRDEVVDALFMQIRLDIKGLQTWRSTLRFKPVGADVSAEGSEGTER
jgi:hypothetical protein